MVYTSLGDINAGCHLTNDLQGCGAGLDTSLLKATVIPIPSGGFALPDVFTQRLRQTGGRGVILVEGTVASSEQLVLEAVANGQVLATATLPMRVAPVEEMYQRISLRGDGTSVATGDVLPPFDDSAGHVFFLHGFHVDTTVAREWGAEMFKRLWQSGSQARFHSITWDGDIGWPDGVHYHDDAVSAFQAAPRLAAYVDAQSGRKIAMAHSLGNVVVSSAIQDDGMLVEKQFMFNAAVASEAFDPSQWSTAVSGNNMIHEEWTDYLPRTWSALYHQLFSPDVVFGEDGRYSLTWQGRFSGCVTNLYNYYSSGDEVFEQYAGTPNPTEGLAWHLGLPVLTGFERYCWQKQELYKGRDDMGELSGLFGTSLAGWGFELVSLMGEAPHPAYTATEANAFTEEDLAETQCISFRRTPPEFFVNMIAEADQRALLARALPALSGAAGNRPISPDDVDNIDMNNKNPTWRPNGWGRDHEVYEKRWLHGDIKNMAYFYIKRIFDEVVEKGSLK